MTGWNPPPEPTPGQCSDHLAVSWDGGPRGTLHGFACWYPQMGGYVGRCVVEFVSGDGCFEAWVWHDGDFPFAGEGPRRGEDTEPCPCCDRPPASGPIRLHHCMARQFVDFGKLVQEKMTGARP